MVPLECGALVLWLWFERLKERGTQNPEKQFCCLVRPSLGEAERLALCGRGFQTSPPLSAKLRFEYTLL
jgi:hypothetical protein